jgi:hypothetical protein
MEVDPDAVVCWIGADPGFQMDLSWKNLIGQASGESYMFQWANGAAATVIIQPEERTSGVDISMDGKRTGSKPTTQSRVSMGTSMNDLGSQLSGLGNMLGGNGNGGGLSGGISGLGGMLGL